MADQVQKHPCIPTYHVLPVRQQQGTTTEQLDKQLYSCGWQTCSMRCITANMLQTNKVDAQCDILATELIWQRFASRVAKFQLPKCILPTPPSARNGYPGTRFNTRYTGTRPVPGYPGIAQYPREICEIV